ncbi:hypothetical protein [Planobispora rosea]|nr:hypothetical protein [Planobispora rosea]
MLAQTFSSDDADLSLLPDSDVFSGAGPDSSSYDEPGPFDADGPFGTEDHTGDHTGDHAGDRWDALGSDPGDPGDAGHHEDLHAADDAHGTWDPLFGGDV